MEKATPTLTIRRFRRNTLCKEFVDEKIATQPVCGCWINGKRGWAGPDHCQLLKPTRSFNPRIRFVRSALDGHLLCRFCRPIPRPSHWIGPDAPAEAAETRQDGLCQRLFAIAGFSCGAGE